MDISTIAFAAALALAAMLAAIVARRARSSAKGFIDIAAALYAGLAVAQISTMGPAFINAVALIAVATTPSALVLAVYSKLVRRPSPSVATLALVGSALSGAAAVFFAFTPLALLPLVASMIALVVLGALHLRSKTREALLIVASAFALIAGASAYLDGGMRALSLFAAVSLLGITLAVSPPLSTRIEQQGWTRRRLVTRRKR